MIVCTRNRVSLLVDTLESLKKQALAREGYEVLVIDNASADSTHEVAERSLDQGGLRGRCVREQELGLNHARNRGVAEAAGRIVAFLDDDARADPTWLEALVGAFSDEAPSGVGGRIELVWQTRPPLWQHRGYLRMLAWFDLGAERCRVDHYPYLVGTNMSFTRETFGRVGLFDPRFDRRGEDLLSMGDTEFCHRVVRSGGTLLYEPRALVRHVVPPERARLSFLLRRSYSNGRSLCRLKALRDDLDAKPSRPVALVRTVGNLLRQLKHRDPAESARLMSSIAWHLGYMREAGSPGAQARRDHG